MSSLRTSPLLNSNGASNNQGPRPQRAAAVLAHIAAALMAHERRLALEGSVPPPLVADLTQLLLECVKVRQSATRLYEPVANGHDHDMSAPLLLTKGAAASLLSVSLRTVERLIAAGRLPVVHVEGASRIRAADLTAYVKRLDAESPPAAVRVTRPTFGRTTDSVLAPVRSAPSGNDP